ncbi:MAG TPA: TonB-dependent receptor [Vicinamibacterales bacterium]|jgi:hypothetical protein
MKRLAETILIGAVLTLVTAAAAHAQSIAGTVRDATGSVLPGVTVEASSPALIEKTRSVVSDGAGQYRIVSLRPGVYTVTFTLPGFATIRRDGIELQGDFTATVSAELRVGAVEETITVSGVTPLVDVQSLTKQTVLTREVLDQLPSSHTIEAAGVLTPGVTGSGLVGNNGRDVGGTTGLQQPSLTFRGTIYSVTRWDTFHLSNLTVNGAGGGTSFYVNAASAQEIAYSSGADSVDMQFPGLYVDLVPKDGGNRFNGYLFGDFTYDKWSASNLGPDLEARGITNVAKVYHISDFNPGVGGPIKKDRLWFYAAYRYQAVDSSVVDSYYDKNPAPYLYEPDLSRPAHDNGKIPNESVRVTLQATANDKIQAWFTNQNKYRPVYGVTATTTPDAAGSQRTRYAQPMTFKWTRTQTNKLLFEGGAAWARVYFDNGYQSSVTTSYDRAVIEATPIYAITDQANGKSFGASIAGYSAVISDQRVGRFVTSYITGSHAIKGGFEIGSGRTPVPSWYTGDLTETFTNGVPQAVTLRLPNQRVDGYFPDLQLYMQDRYTFGRATVTGGLRYDYFVGYVGDSTLPASRWSPSQSFTGFEVQHWKDLSPRVGAAYDLFGTGKTAIKGSFARYVQPEATAIAAANDPQLTIGRTDTRTWRDLNGDYTIYNADGSVQMNELGPSTNQNFGKVIPSTTTTDPATLNGFNARIATIEWQAVVQHDLGHGVALNGGYYFRYLGNQLATDNTLVGAADYDGPFCITAPNSPDLPGGGGYPVCGLYDLKPTAFGKLQNNVTLARKFGGLTDHYMGFDLGVNARLGPRTFIQGGLNSQRRVYDTCNAPILAGPATNPNQVDNPEALFCHQVTPYRPDVKLFGSHTFPHDITASAAYQLSSGPNVTALWNVPNSVIAPALGRNLSAGATATKAVNLIEPGVYWSPYLNQLDVRLSKGFRMGPYRIRGDVNVYNLFNSDFVNSVNTTFSTTASNQFLRPTNVLQGRLLKVGGQIQF